MMKEDIPKEGNQPSNEARAEGPYPVHPSAFPGDPLANPAVWKEWAHQHFKGVENQMIPSFTPDFFSLSEQGIRLDIQQTIRHGFFATMCSGSGAGVVLDFRETMALLDIATDEAKGKLLVGAAIMLPVILGYTAYVYWIFRGKVTADAGYHH